MLVCLQFNAYYCDEVEKEKITFRRIAMRNGGIKGVLGDVPYFSCSEWGIC